MNSTCLYPYRQQIARALSLSDYEKNAAKHSYKCRYSMCVRGLRSRFRRAGQGYVAYQFGDGTAQLGLARHYGQRVVRRGVEPDGWAHAVHAGFESRAVTG